MEQAERVVYHQAAQTEPRLPIPVSAFFSKAREDLADAQAAVDAARYNACARSTCYAAFHAAVAALWAEGIRPREGTGGTLSQKMVQGEWASRLIYRRRLYPPELRNTLSRLFDLRVRADYRPENVTSRDARRAVGLSERLVAHVEARLLPSLS